MDQVFLLSPASSPTRAHTAVAPPVERVLFPAEFVGRGDMSRGGLMLRSVRDGRELGYQPILGAIRRGTQPPKLAPAPAN